MLDAADVRRAAAALSGRVHRTPLLSSRAIGDMAGLRLFLKCESLQKTGSFKARGALNKVLSLSGAERARGLITVSAGNHAQAVAWAGAQVGARVVVVMPSDAPGSKIAAVRGYGGEVVAHDDRATVFDRLREEQGRTGAVFIHPFDDPVVLAGAGTVGLEIVEALPDVDIVAVPTGGGGLLGGIATAVKSVRPETRIVAVELEAGPGLGPALEAGEPVAVTRPAGTVADGMTPPFVGALPLRIAQSLVDDVVTVREADVMDAMRALMTRARLVAEGAGAAATAAVLSGRIAKAGARVAVVVSGGNVDPARFAGILLAGTDGTDPSI